MWDKMVNYLLWKVLVVGAVLEPSLRDLIVWATWLSIVGLMHTFSCLANERFKNVRWTTHAGNFEASILTHSFEVDNIFTERCLVGTRSFNFVAGALAVCRPWLVLHVPCPLPPTGTNPSILFVLRGTLDVIFSQ